MSMSVKSCGIVLGLVSALLVPAAANEAVSTTNFMVDGFYGNIDGETGKGVGGLAAVPLGDSYGLQVDGLYGEVNPDDIKGAGLHTFWRKSTLGLVGLTASLAEWENSEAIRVGAEGEYYWDQFTFGGFGGHQSGDVDDSWYGGLVGRFYPLEDLMLSAAATTTDDFEVYIFGVEYQTPVPGLCVFATVAAGEDDYDHTLFGVQYYFGGSQKTLIRRHREDNVAVNLFGNLLGAVAGVSEPPVPEPEPD